MSAVTLVGKLKLRWHLMLRAILMLWVKPRIQADADGNTGISGDQPVCYVMDAYALSTVLILDACCEEKQLARPLLSVPIPISVMCGLKIVPLPPCCCIWQQRILDLEVAGYRYACVSMTCKKVLRPMSLIHLA